MGTLPLSAGLIGVIPALALLNPEMDHSPPLILSYPYLVLWCFSLAFFGVFLAVILRQQVIVKENLTFPSGTATAQIISVLHAIPPPKERGSERDGGIRRRRTGVHQYDPVAGSDTESPETTSSTKVDRSGWTALSISFIISSMFSFISLLFPVLSAIPLFDIFGQHLAANWLWW